jgi:tetratricopeptide (TPR) repeat protein
MPYPQPAVHRTILVVDVGGFGDRRRTNPRQVAVRDGLYRVLRQALHAADIQWGDCHREDRGDGVFILAPADVPKARFVESMLDALVAALRGYNTAHPAEEQIRLRMVLHAGEVTYDDHGVTSTAINLAFRLLDAAPLKAALADSPGLLALITSSWFFDEVVRHSSGVEPATYRPIGVSVKETTTVGWIALPDHPFPFDPTYLTPAPRGPASPVFGQLPSSPRSFIGRGAELAALTTALNTAAEQGSTMVISAIGGTGGIGKTWLALYWAHQHIQRFPDGQLFVNLRGFDPTGQPMPAGTALRGFLDAFEVDPGRIPVDLEAQAALYRTLVAGKRMLIVLDNARDTDQVLPLLPGSSSCTVLVTSRRQLTGLVTAHDAQPVTLDVLTDAEARELLARRLGKDRLNAEPQAVAELLTCCAGFPLPLGIVAARARLRPAVPLAVFAAELHDASCRLDALDSEDLHASFRAALSWSYHTLDTEAAGVFRLLGLAPGPDISLPAAASLTARSTTHTQLLLQRLDEAYLVQQHQPGRYRMHDLVKLYAGDRAVDDHPTQEQEAALRRLVDHYTHAAYAGERLLDPQRPNIAVDPPTPGSHPHRPLDRIAALGWFEAEHPNLLATQQVAVERGWHARVWQLAWALNTFQWRRGHRQDAVAVWGAAVAAAEQFADPTIQILARRRLGHACALLNRHAEAGEHLHQALTLAEHSGDLHSQAHTHYVLAVAWERQGEDRRALEHTTCALRLYQALNNPAWEAEALNWAGWLSARLGEHDQARTHCQAALDLCRRHHYREGEAATMDSLGYIAYRTGQHAEAVGYYQQALNLHRDLGITYAEADTLNQLGHAYAAAAQYGQARDVWRHAWELYQAQHRIEDAERVEHQLDTLDQPPADNERVSTR